MSNGQLVTNHYTLGSLLDTIEQALVRLGKSVETVTLEDLAPVEEFHIGGRAATATFLEQLGLNADHHVLDVGCGLGGASRYVATHYGATVTGIDLTAEYVETGRVLNRWVDLADAIQLDVGSATELPYADGAFDKVYMMHVGMNIADKSKLANELVRVLKPGGELGIYDVMLTGEDNLTYPVPWATKAEGSALASPEQYREILESVGFELLREQNRRDFAVEFFDRLRAQAAAAEGPPPLGLHLVMGENAPLKVKNMIENIHEGRVAPVELVVQKIRP